MQFGGFNAQQVSGVLAGDCGEIQVVSTGAHCHHLLQSNMHKRLFTIELKIPFAAYEELYYAFQNVATSRKRFAEVAVRRDISPILSRFLVRNVAC
jgi:hypothetical protein